MKHGFFTLLLFACIGSATAQYNENYLDYLGRPVPVERASFYTTTYLVNDLYYHKVYYIREDRLQMDGFFTKADCKIKQGLFYYYYPNGNIEKLCNYKKNKLNGRYISFYKNGMMKDSAYYTDDRINGYKFSWHSNGMFKDSMSIYDDGSGGSISWYSNGQPCSGGYFAAGGQPRGTWQYFHFNGKLAAKERYENGKPVEKKYYDTTGKEERDSTISDRVLSFPGGDAAWKKYVSDRAIVPSGWESIKTGDIVVVVTAVIDHDGHVTDAFVSSPFHPAFDQVALKIITSSPQWLPAIEHHRAVDTEVVLPVSFVQAK